VQVACREASVTESVRRDRGGHAPSRDRLGCPLGKRRDSSDSSRSAGFSSVTCGKPQSGATTTHVCQRVTLHWQCGDLPIGVEFFAMRRFVVPGDWRRYGGGSRRRGARVQVAVLQ